MKHIWILNHYAQEPGGVGGTRHYSLARHLPHYGWKATIIAASTDHAAGTQRLGGGETSRLQDYDGVPFLWLGARAYAGNGGDRVGNMLDYTRAVLRRKNLSGLDAPDAIIGSSVHPFAAWAGRKLARRFGVPFIFEVRDLWPQTLIDMGRLSQRHPAAVALRALEKSLYRDAARIIVLLPKAHDYIEPLGISLEKIVWIPNGVDVENFPTRPPRQPDGAFTLMYFGAHGGANGLENLLAAMQRVGADPAGQNIVLRLIGDGPLKSTLVAKAREEGLTNVRFEDPVPKSQIPDLAAQADAFVFNLIDAPVFKYGISSNKLFDFLAAGRPVLFCCTSPNNPIAEAGAGLTVAPENPQALADAILALASLPSDERARMGAAGRRHLEDNYDMRGLAARLASVLDDSLRSR
ncbi:glycosyltransferase family 4 protein [Hyphomicrobium sp.]|uniref:glycosyltransferase family 4 protein n=1 Tax=Hyphomicrobium sp. TaxID=82 RepID=UPI002FE21130